MVGNDLYILGEDSDERPILVKRSIDNGNEEVIPLTKNQYALSLTAVGETIYMINRDAETGQISLEIIQGNGERSVLADVVLSESARFVRTQGSGDIRNIRNAEIVSNPR